MNDRSRYILFIVVFNFTGGSGNSKPGRQRSLKKPKMRARTALKYCGDKLWNRPSTADTKLAESINSFKSHFKLNTNFKIICILISMS